MNINNNTTKLMFYFRSEDSVNNAVSKITQILKTIHNDSSTIILPKGGINGDNKYILTIFNPKLKKIYYTNEIILYDKFDNFVLLLYSMKIELTKSFTNIRIEDLALTLGDKKNFKNLKTKILFKGIPRTDVSISLSVKPIIFNNSTHYNEISWASIPTNSGNTIAPINEVSFKENKEILNKSNNTSILKDSSSSYENTIPSVTPLAVASLNDDDLNNLKSKTAEHNLAINYNSELSNTRLTFLKMNISNIPLFRNGFLTKHKIDNIFIYLNNLSKRIPFPQSNLLSGLNPTNLMLKMSEILRSFKSSFYNGSLELPKTNLIINPFIILINLGLSLAIATLLIVIAIIYISIFSILGTILVKIINTQGLPFILNYIQNIPEFSILFFKTLSSIFKDMSIPNIFKDINITTTNIPIPDVIPQIIKEVETLIVETNFTIPETIKDVLINTTNSLGDNISSYVSTTPEKDINLSEEGSKVDDKDILLSTETLPLNDNENNSGILTNIFYTILYGGLGIVAFDLMTRISIPTIEPEVFTHINDFVGGIASIGFFTVSTLLKILFGNSDNDDSTNSNTSSPDTSANNNSKSKSNLLLEGSSKERYITEGSSKERYITEGNINESLNKNSKADTILGLSSLINNSEGATSSNNFNQDKINIESAPKVIPLSYLPTNSVSNITLNENKDYIELIPITEESDSEDYSSSNYLNDGIMELEKTILQHSQSINEEDKKDIKGIIFKYAEQIRLQTESLNEMKEELRLKTESEKEKDLIIRMNNDILLSQEKLMKQHLEIEREQEVTILRQLSQLKDKELELRVRSNQLEDKDFELQVKSDEIEEKEIIIYEQDTILDEHLEAIQSQELALDKSKAALGLLTNNVNSENGKPLFKKEDVTLLINSLTSSADENSSEKIIPREGYRAFENNTSNKVISTLEPSLNEAKGSNWLVLPEDYSPKTKYVPNEEFYSPLRDVSPTKSEDKSLTLTYPLSESQNASAQTVPIPSKEGNKIIKPVEYVPRTNYIPNTSILYSLQDFSSTETGNKSLTLTQPYEWPEKKKVRFDIPMHDNSIYKID